MGMGAYAAHVAYQQDRVRASYVGQKAAEDPHSQVRVAEAAAELDAAWLALERNMAELMACARAGGEDPAAAAAAGPPGPGARHRPGDQRGGPAVRELRRPGAQAGTPIQRFWRDAHAGRVHAINDPERALSMFGRGEFGLRIQPDGML